MIELKAYKGDVTIPVYGTIADAEVYLKKEADEAIAELKRKLEGAKNETNFWCNNLKVFAQKKDSEIAKLKAEIKRKEGVGKRWFDRCMEIRRLRRALYKACANWAHATIYYSGVHESDEFKWENMETECLAKAEEYK